LEIIMVSSDDIVRMRAQLFFEGPEVHHRVSRFWLLLVLSAIIAGAGVASNSTATVIGAMIVAPLMSPILGIVLAVVLNDRRNLLLCIGTVLAGVITVITLSFLLGLVVPEPVTAATNSQVASRVSPDLLDLLAALATGAVGSIALIRSDISDTLPGVAIAISLVPPLTVVGLTLESGAPDEAWGAFVLFVANVSAILATGVVTMAVYGVLRGRTVGGRERKWRRPGVIIIVALVIIVAVPLTTTSLSIARTSSQQAAVSEVVDHWATAHGWSVVSVGTSAHGFVVRVIGPPPPPATDQLRAALTDAGVDSPVQLELVPESQVTIEPGR
jgi:uncharacterized hydrophobic protein (TIGR00271 family)